MDIMVVLLIFSIVLLDCLYGARRYIIVNKQRKVKMKNNALVREQILDWGNNTFKIRMFTKEELFTPSKMKNGEVDLDGLEINVINYSENVPWFIRK